MKRIRCLAPHASAYIWIDHISDNRARANNGNLNHKIIKLHGAHPRQARHLCAAFHLKQSDGVGLLQPRINLGIVIWDMCKLHIFAICIPYQFQGILKNRHHPKTQQIDFYNPHVSAVFLVPLYDYTARHTRRLKRHNGIQLPLTHNQAARMLAEMSWKILHQFVKFEKFGDPWTVKIQSRIAELMLSFIVWIFPFPAAYQ